MHGSQPWNLLYLPVLCNLQRNAHSPVKVVAVYLKLARLALKPLLQNCSACHVLQNLIDGHMTFMPDALHDQ